MVGWRERVVPPLAVALLVAGMAVIPALRDPRFYLTDDSAAQFLPSWYHLGELLRSGQFPLLDPTLWAGGNIAAEALFGIWNPVLLATMVFVSLVPNLVVASVVVKAFFLVLLALGVYGLAREYDVTRGFAAVAAVTVPFAGVTLYFEQAVDRFIESGRQVFTRLAAFGLRDSRRLFLAFHDGKVIAGSVVRFTPSGVAEYSANNSRPSALNLRPNSLLNWVAIQWSHAQGLRVYSMGGAHPFLRHFGGSEIPIYRYRKDLTLFRRHDRAEWARAKVGGVVRAVRKRLKERREANQSQAEPTKSGPAKS